GTRAIFKLKETLDRLSKRDQDLARNSLFVGMAMNEFKDDIKPGDFLVRGILGIEQTTGSLVVGELLKPGRTVQFHLRDALTSSDDLRQLLHDYTCDHQSHPEHRASGALLFSCLGRGRHL